MILGNRSRAAKASQGQDRRVGYWVRRRLSMSDCWHHEASHHVGRRSLPFTGEHATMFWRRLTQYDDIALAIVDLVKKMVTLT
jgi:hypothetical protein